MTDDTILCRCEDLTFGEVREWINKGYNNFEELKRVCRIGMGACQGKSCREALLKELVKVKGSSISEETTGVYRPLLKPVKLGTLARGDLDD
ncbi:(2Fe-2S)-binding protein [Natranaerobius thermophilus]|uniref:BFD domain protein (2Fe-2S)-binding domain protein n=1 Tax=Natranaerobius thermophilus (strain ATCC BAA-1301 / DSM 18059 / JW/NM-WN-LF) TaxID=457570 RepID=B2A5H1_NATTJ|nr:(2Fe-2S)-binding protein [Natranaerobius thermophilus]ACB85326.1 BFD domain protein (2Fe-2S)-binding domain protein [Natranaerobius thermophilus JW/NM-WN-LF]